MLRNSFLPKSLRALPHSTDKRQDRPFPGASFVASSFLLVLSCFLVPVSLAVQQPDADHTHKQQEIALLEQQGEQMLREQMLREAERFQHERLQAKVQKRLAEPRQEWVRRRVEEAGRNRMAKTAASSAFTLEQDSLALVALYNATNGPNWTNNENWLTGPVSSWFGVDVNIGNNRVIRLDLRNNQLSGAIPSSS